MHTVIIKNSAYTFIRWIICFIFLYAGITKLLDIKNFTVTIEAFGIIPDHLSIYFALMIPILEITGAVGLFLNRTESLFIITGLIILFLIVLGYGIYLGLDVDCGCFGPEDPEADTFKSLKSAMIKNFIIIAGMMYMFYVRFSPVYLKKNNPGLTQITHIK